MPDSSTETRRYGDRPSGDWSTEIQHYWDQPLEGLLDELALYREAAAGPLRGPAETWRQLVPYLRQRVCDQWAWCERRQDARQDDPLALVILLKELIAPDALTWQVPAALIAVILVKKGLDAFCRCP